MNGCHDFFPHAGILRQWHVFNMRDWGSVLSATISPAIIRLGAIGLSSFFFCLLFCPFSQCSGDRSLGTTPRFLILGMASLHRDYQILKSLIRPKRQEF